MVGPEVGFADKGFRLSSFFRFQNEASWNLIRSFALQECLYKRCRSSQPASFERGGHAEKQDDPAENTLMEEGAHTTCCAASESLLKALQGGC